MVLNKLEKIEMERLARGREQKWIVWDLIRYGESDPLNAYIKKQGYYTQYINSFMNLLERLREAGFLVTLIPGKKGGYWTAKIKLQD